jgi:hypothetical protein
MTEQFRQSDFFEIMGFSPSEALESVHCEEDRDSFKRESEVGERQEGKEDGQGTDLISLVKRTKLDYLKGDELIFPDFLGSLDARTARNLLCWMEGYGVDVRFAAYATFPEESRVIITADIALTALCYADKRIREEAYRRWVARPRRVSLRHPDDHQLPSWLPK